MTEFNPNCGRCGMLNSCGFCSLTACRYPSNVIVVESKVIRGMMVNPQIEKPMTHFDEIKAMSVEELANFICGIYELKEDMHGDYDYRLVVNGNEFRAFADLLDWLKSTVEVGDNGT